MFIDNFKTIWRLHTWYYLQYISTGRGRAADSKYFVITEQKTGMAEKEELNGIREIMMRKAIIQLQVMYINYGLSCLYVLYLSVLLLTLFLWFFVSLFLFFNLYIYIFHFSIVVCLCLYSKMCLIGSQNTNIAKATFHRAIKWWC